jgi:hypothetical protein
MDEEVRWEQHKQAAAAGIQALGFMVGKWSGTGTSYGATVTGTLTVRPILDGTWLEATETLFDASGSAEHTDISLYRYDPEESRLEVVHLMGHAHMSRYPVEPVGPALHWITGPAAPRLAILPQPSGLRMEVQFPQEAAPVVTMDYLPA